MTIINNIGFVDINLIYMSKEAYSFWWIKLSHVTYPLKITSFFYEKKNL